MVIHYNAFGMNWCEADSAAVWADKATQMPTKSTATSSQTDTHGQAGTQHGSCSDYTIASKTLAITP